MNEKKGCTYCEDLSGEDSVLNPIFWKIKTR